ncbi:MAG TPA: flagellar M-ring protein FliF [Deltaproteobacteria bacterium]|nr:flagellar M-ring protein FliF [Deltaproteobacteria bacterium]
MKDTFMNIAARFSAMSMGQRFGLFAACGLVLAVVLVTLMWSLAPKYQYLFTDLSEADASMIVQNLKENRVPYKLVKGGSAIMIPEESVYETRLSLAGQGLPKGGLGKGFALFDETGFSTSEFVQKINYQRALQNELANTIMALEEVEFARVHIALPKETIFIEDEKPAKASIVIKPKPGLNLNSQKVQGIVYLVEKSVRGLEPENISIVDIKGKVLYEGKGSSAAVSLASKHLEVKNAIETLLQTRAQDLLERIVGSEAAIVKVSSDINMDMVKSVQDTFDPEVHIVRSEEMKSTFNSADRFGQGIAGTQSNLPTGRGGPEQLPQNASSGGSDIIRNYEIGRNQVERIYSPGDITRLTVSVVVDGRYEASPEGNKTFIPRPASELREIENAVKHAVGFNADRDDTISVSCIPFAQVDSDIGAISESAQRKELISALAKPVLLFAVILMLLLFVVRPMLKWATKSVKVLENVPDTQRALQAGQTEQIEADETPLLEVAAKSDDLKRAVHGKRKLIEKISKDDMGSATAVVKSWLQENT